MLRDCACKAPPKANPAKRPQSTLQSTLHSRKGYIASNTNLSGKTCIIPCFEGCFEGVLWGRALRGTLGGGSPGASGETSGGTVCGRVLSRTRRHALPPKFVCEAIDWCSLQGCDEYCCICSGIYTLILQFATKFTNQRISSQQYYIRTITSLH